MRIILLRSCFFLVTHFMMHGMDPIEPPRNSNPRRSPLPELPLLPLESTEQPTILITTPTKSTKPRATTDPNLNIPPLDSRKRRPYSISLSPRSSKDKKTEDERENKFLSKDKKEGSRSPSRHRRIPPLQKTQSRHAIPRQHEVKFELLSSAIKKGDIDTLRKFLNNLENNPNLQNKHGLTLLHQAVLSTATNKDSIIKCFLKEPRLETLITNKKNLAAYQYLIGTEDMRKQLNLRARLDYIVHALLTTDILFFTDNSVTDKMIEEEKINILLSRLSPIIIPRYATTEFIFAMIKSRLEKYVPRFRAIYNNFKKDLNYQDEYGNTYLHLACYLHDKTIIKKLIQNPQIELKRNNDKCFPQGIFSTSEETMKNIRKKIFIRDSLDRWIRNSIKEECLALQKLNIFKLNNDDPCIKNIITKVKAQCTAVKQKQFVDDGDGSDEDGQLPSKTADLPDYATDDFIFQSIKNRIINCTNEKLKRCILNSKTLEGELLVNPTLDISQLTIDIELSKDIIKETKIRYAAMYDELEQNKTNQEKQSSSEEELSSTVIIHPDFIPDDYLLTLIVNYTIMRNLDQQLYLTKEAKTAFETEAKTYREQLKQSPRNIT